MKFVHLAASLVLVLVAFPASSPSADLAEGSMTSELPEHHVEDSSAAAVTRANLLASERFWPYRVALSRAWQPPGPEQALPSGATGVLIRVEEDGKHARIDFGRDGIHEVPVDQTDLVESANRVRRGELEKLAPNFVLAIGPRLLDSKGDALHPLGFRAASEQRLFLCVFADPSASDFASLAQALAALDGRPGLLAVLFPHGRHGDVPVHDRLHALSWTPAFVYDHLAEAYSRTLLAEGTPLPFLLLQTGEGRVLFGSRWEAGAVAKIESALDRATDANPAR
jgi:hypothetical protein